MTINMATSGTSFEPYIGLRAFTADENELFFGRARESLEIARLWRAKQLTILYGASGVGKTSLLQAGVLPALDPARVDVMPVGRIRPGSPYPATPPPVRNPYSFALLSTWAPDEPAHALATMTIGDFLRGRGESPDRYGDPKPMLLAIDQAEELFTSLPERQFLGPFIDELAEALHKCQGARLLLALREDYLAAVLPYEHLLASQARTRLRLLPFGHDVALEAIRGPLQGTGRSFEPEAAEELIADLRTIVITNTRGEESTVTVDSIEPVQIQIVCSALWASLPAEATVITSAHVREHANVDRFLADFCGRALSTVARKYGIAAAEIRSWLQQTFVTELGTRGTAYQGIEQTAGMPNAVVMALEDQHILKAEHRSSSRWYELQHDRLIEPIRQSDPAEYLEAAKAARKEEAWDLVEKNAKQAIRGFAADDLRVRAEAGFLLGDVAGHRGEHDTALKRYRTAAGLFEVLQDSAAVGASLAAAGRLSLASGHYVDAAIDLQAAIARNPSDLEVQTDLALALWHTGLERAAVAVLNNVLADRSNLATALRARGEILADLGEVERALHDLERVRHHQQPGTRAARALALALAGRFDAAEQEAADALANGPDNGPVLLRVARVRALAGDRRKAAQLAEAALGAAEAILPPHLREQALLLLGEPHEIASDPAAGTAQPSPSEPDY